MAETAQRPTLAEALRTPEFRAMLPRLVAFAAGCLRRAGWGEGRDRAPAALAVEDVVQEMAERCISGAREWPEGVPLEGFLYGVIRSVVSHGAEVARALWNVQGVSLEACVDVAAPDSGRDATEDRWRLVAAMKRELQGGDPDVERLFAAYADGWETRGDIAEALGWDPEYVSAVRVKMIRRLVAVDGLMDDYDDGWIRRDRPQGGAPAHRRRAR
jgi:DNA-directed RNA polymerase specialized sigma24 family protein